MIQIDRKTLKRQAREAMGMTHPKFWVVTLVYILLTTGVDSLMHILSSTLSPAEDTFGFFSLFCTVLFTLYSLIVQFGFNLWSLWSYRKLNPGVGSLVQGFSIAGSVILMEIFIFLRILGWILLLAIFVTIVISLIPSLVISLFSFGLIYAAIFAISLRYAMAPYLLADRPDDGAGIAVNRSVEMMRGRKWELFKLHLSFLGWYLINFLLSSAVSVFFLVQSGVLGASFSLESLLVYQSVINSLVPFLLSSLVTIPLTLWLTPYVSVAQAGFYDTLCRMGNISYDSQMPPL